MMVRAVASGRQNKVEDWAGIRIAPLYELDVTGISAHRASSMGGEMG